MRRYKFARRLRQELNSYRSEWGGSKSKCTAPRSTCATTQRPRRRIRRSSLCKYCVASALLRGHAGLRDFAPERIADPAIAQLLAHTSVHYSETFEAAYPRQWPSNVTVAFADGRVMSQTINAPKGDPENPLSQTELEAKFKQMLDGTPCTAKQWIEFVGGLVDAERVVLPS